MRKTEEKLNNSNLLLLRNIWRNFVLNRWNFKLFILKYLQWIWIFSAYKNLEASY